MKGTVKASELAAAVKTAQSIIWKGAQIDSLKHVRMTASAGVLEVEATNLYQHMAIRLDAAISDGAAIVDPVRLLTALQPISGDATVSCADNFMSLSGKGARSRLALLPTETWTNVETPAADVTFGVAAESLLAAFETVAPAIADDVSRLALCGVHLKWEGASLIAEAMGGKLILAREIAALRPDTWPDRSVIVPREFVTASSKLLPSDAILSVSDSRIILLTPKGRLASKLIDATYPQTERAWDKEAAPALRADRESMLKVVKLAHQFSEADRHGQRVMVIHNGEVLAFGANGDIFRAPFEGEYIKEQVYSFQPRILLSALSALTSEIVEMTDGGSLPNSIVIHGDGARTCVVAQTAPPAWWRREMAAEQAEAA